MSDPVRNESTRENEMKNLQDTFLRQYDECAVKIQHLSDSMPTFVEKAKSFQESTDNLSTVLVDMKKEMKNIQQQSKEALAPILPLYNLRTKVCRSLFSYFACNFDSFISHIV